eukprot:CAMPEP_0174701818 /NCGR_PEP_ID=MMETSP1094-20130205/6327_1 /TAXON_ID=156173 /ORGANISM="Chrysochromulina brevifilum, Strain UTEX LB 985" /LENGTH=457 /DNA_ID=CAMNT_0015899517 /DNA_START=1 /DNA_END=1375 /DNA_ORIENTATION=-
MQAALAGGGDDGGGGGGGAFGGLNIMGESDQDAVRQMQAAMAKPEPVDKNAFEFSQSGAFKLSDFQIRPVGGMTTVDEDSVAVPSHPNELDEAANDPTLEVNSLAELEMLEKLGAGASGTVHRARHKSTGAIVAVKCVSILEQSKRDQLITELRIMRSHTLGTRWLVRMHNAFYEEARVYTVLEMMDGGSLEDLVKTHAPRGGLHDEVELGRIALDLLSGINHLHRQLHQMHRDLKPANVMLNSSGAVKISDFGISSQLAESGAFAETFVGTTCYMSPERLSGEAYSTSADIWAFGLIMLELATGKYPYKVPDSYFDLLNSIMDEPQPTLGDEAGFSDDFAQLISICLDKDQTMRPSARDLLNHPWVRQFEQSQRAASASSEGLDRSRTHHNMDMSGMMAGMSLNHNADTDIAAPAGGKASLSSGVRGEALRGRRWRCPLHSIAPCRSAPSLVPKAA